MNNMTCMLASNFKFQDIYEVTIQVIVFTIFAFSQWILKLGLKMRSFSKSTFPGLLKNVLTFNPRWPLTTENRWEGFQNDHIIIFFWNLVVCSGFLKLKTYTQSCLWSLDRLIFTQVLKHVFERTRVHVISKAKSDLIHSILGVFELII